MSEFVEIDNEATSMEAEREKLMSESKNRLVMTFLSVNKVLKGVKADVD
jgi:hypothetical protein